jgi:hypothetical protein
MEEIVFPKTKFVPAFPAERIEERLTDGTFCQRDIRALFQDIEFVAIPFLADQLCFPAMRVATFEIIPSARKTSRQFFIRYAATCFKVPNSVRHPSSATQSKRHQMAFLSHCFWKRGFQAG